MVNNLFFLFYIGFIFLVDVWQKSSSLKIETFVFYVISFIGLSVALIANDFLLLFLAVEVHNVAFYVLLFSGKRGAAGVEILIKYI